MLINPTKKREELSKYLHADTFDQIA